MGFAYETALGRTEADARAILADAVRAGALRPAVLARRAQPTPGRVPARRADPVGLAAARRRLAKLTRQQMAR